MSDPVSHLTSKEELTLNKTINLHQRFNATVKSGLYRMSSASGSQSKKTLPYTSNNQNQPSSMMLTVVGNTRSNENSVDDGKQRNRKAHKRLKTEVTDEKIKVLEKGLREQ